MAQRLKVHIQGIVQGVGFRPFIYQLAHRHHLNGYVTNTPRGVELEVEGDQKALHHFLTELPESAPPLARITEITTEELPPAAYTAFEIKSSAEGEERAALISPDTATCADCLSELFDQQNRRYLYPFLNCTNCGPRYTIINDIPYDRPKTSMASFIMCDDCAREYHEQLEDNSAVDLGEQATGGEEDVAKDGPPIEKNKEDVGTMRLGEKDVDVAYGNAAEKVEKYREEHPDVSWADAEKIVLGR